ncbi:MAG: ABC transporter permease [Proteobacteria bacterium]|nr:ABC transporter permease [Pseudomonadota bacterium]
MHWGYVFKELRRRHHRSLANILGIGIGTALFVAIHAASAGYQLAAAQPFKNLGADLIVQRAQKRDARQAGPVSMQGIRLPFSNQLLSAQDFRKLQSMPGVDASASALLLWEFGDRGFRNILGVNLDQPHLGPVKVDEWLVQGRFARHAGEAVLEKHFAKFHHLQPGSEITIGRRPFAVVGLVEIKAGAQINSANIYLPLDTAQDLIQGGPSAVNIVYLRLKKPSLAEQSRQQIAAALPGADVTSADSIQQLMGGVSRISDRFARLAAWIAFAGAFVLIVKSMLASVLERSAEIGILKAVGWTGADVRAQIVAEVLAQAVLGGLLGILLGYLMVLGLSFLTITAALPWDVNPLPASAKISPAAATAVRLPVRLSLSLAAASLGLCLSAGLLAGFLTARRAGRTRPMDALRKL